MPKRHLACSSSKYDETLHLLAALKITVVTTRRYPSAPDELLIEVEHDGFKEGSEPLALAFGANIANGIGVAQIAIASFSVLAAMAQRTPSATFIDSKGERFAPLDAVPVEGSQS